MNQQETMIVIKAICLAYPSKIKDEDLPITVSMWQKQFNDIPFRTVNDAVIDWIGTSRFLPTIADIKERCMPAIEYTNPWYAHFPKEGDFTYNDRELDWVNKLPMEQSWEIWKQLPNEMNRRMHYCPDSNDAERNLLIEKALKFQKKLREGE